MQNVTERLNQIDVNLDKDTELYANYLLRNTYTLDSTVFTWYQKNLTALDDKLPLRLERNPNSKKIKSLGPLQEPAPEALLQKADCLYTLAKVRMNDALALQYVRTPFEPKLCIRNA